MNRTEKLSMISSFETSYLMVEEEISGIGREELLFIPPIRDAWSINDFLVHFLDADLSLAFRMRTAIAEPGKAVPVWEEEAWHDSLEYQDEDGLISLGLAKGIRTFLATTLRSVLQADWSMFSIVHPSRGKLALPGLITMYEEHVVFHLPLIRRNRRAYEQRPE
jgi:hypothetical protein